MCVLFFITANKKKNEMKTNKNKINGYIHIERERENICSCVRSEREPLVHESSHLAGQTESVCVCV